MLANSVGGLSSSEVIYDNSMHESKWHAVLKKRADGKVLWGSLHPFLSFRYKDNRYGQNVTKVWCCCR